MEKKDYAQLCASEPKMKNCIAAALVALLIAVGCAKPYSTSEIAKSKTTKTTLVELANADSPSRVVRDVQGNIIELDLVGLRLSDECVAALKDPELASLQKLSLSGEWITPHFFHRIEAFGISPIRELVLIDTAIPPDHIWVEKFRRKFNSTLITFRTNNTTNLETN